MPIGSPAFMVFALVKVFTYELKFDLYDHFVIRSYSNTYPADLGSWIQKDFVDSAISSFGSYPFYLYSWHS